MLDLFQFQENAAAAVSAKVATYLEAPARTTVAKKPHVAPFFQALSALTGAGKTVILAEAAAQIAEAMPVRPVIMWLSRGKVVVRQTFVNLSAGGKYHHLLDGMAVEVLGNYRPEAVADANDGIVYFATVGTFNQKDKQGGTLLIHKSDVDNMEASVWDALRLRADNDGNRRPLIVVYDEAQNLSNQQTELLLELEPDGFLLASATMRLPARIGAEVQHIRTAGYDEEDLYTKVLTRDVVAEGLVKETLLLEGYNAPMEETVAQMLDDWKEATADAADLGLDLTPKCIYVCNTNVVADTPNTTDDPRQPFDHRQAPPILIWRYLTEQMGVDPTTIAVYADLKTDKDFPLPHDFVLYRGGDTDYDDFTAGSFQHVIFNLTLQEGWDDPSVYFAYIDKSMESTVQITQVIGRVLRQPGVTHYPAPRLNAAHFYVRVDKNDVFNTVVEDVQNELGGEPGGIKIVSSAPGRPKPIEYPAREEVFVPETGLDPGVARATIKHLVEDFADYREGGVNTTGVGSRRVLRQKIGHGGTVTGWDEYEQSSQASARWVFHREIQKQYKAALGVVNLADPKLDARVGIGSAAHKQVTKLGDEVVDAYLKGVRLVQRRLNPYRIGGVLARPDDVLPYSNSLHEGYAGLNSVEKMFADAIDATGLMWSRNPARTGYGIPLISVGPTANFYPDFLVWTTDRVICIDTKGPHLVHETARRKLLRIRTSDGSHRLDVQFVSPGKFDDNLEQKHKDGYTCWGMSDDGTIHAQTFDEMSQVVEFLIDDQAHPD